MVVLSEDSTRHGTQCDLYGLRVLIVFVAPSGSCARGVKPKRGYPTPSDVPASYLCAWMWQPTVNLHFGRVVEFNEKPSSTSNPVMPGGNKTTRVRAV